MSNNFICPNLNIRPTTSNIGFTNTATAAGWKRCFIFTIDEDATITTLAFRQGVVSTGANAFTGTLRVGLQTVSTTTGLPDGTWVGGTSNYADYTGWDGANDNTFVAVTPSASMSLTRGTIYAFCMEVTSFTGSGTPTLSISTTYTNMQLTMGFGYTTTETATTVSDKSDQTPIAPFVLRNSTKSYGNPWQTFPQASLSNASTFPLFGMGFTIPTNICSTFKISGIRMVMAPSLTINSTFDICVFQGTTELQTASFTTNQMRGASSQIQRQFTLNFDVDTLSTLNSGTEYILAIKPTSSTAMNFTYITVAIDQDKTALGDLGFKYYFKSSTGSWSEQTTRIPFMEIIFTDIVGSSTAANPMTGYTI